MKEEGAIHYLEDWPDDVSDQLCWNDDNFGDVDEWLHDIMEAVFDLETLRHNPDERFVAELTGFVSTHSRWGGDAEDITEGLIDNAELWGVEWDTSRIAAEMMRVLTPALGGLSREVGWYEPIGSHIYITAREVVAMIDAEDAACV